MRGILGVSCPEHHPVGTEKTSVPRTTPKMIKQACVATQICLLPSTCPWLFGKHVHGRRCDVSLFAQCP